MEKTNLDYKKIALAGTVFIGLVFIFFFGSALVSKAPLGNTIKNYLFTEGNTSSDEKSILNGENEDRINILLLGVGGGAHEGSDLTDTIILASYQPSTQKVAMMSFPRDLVVYLPDYAWRKINHVSFFAELENPGTGSQATANFMSNMLDIPIHYYTKVNFQAFKQIIDELEGLDIEVENTLEDFQYPIAGRENAEPASSRYEHLYIEKGWQHMDGELALKYARSRHGQGIEGSDYARSRRQQKILEALREKGLSLTTLLNPSKIKGLYEIIDENIDTNFTISELYRLYTLAKNVNKDEIVNKVVDASPDGPLVENSYNGAFVLETKTGNFEELKFMATHIFDDSKEFDYSKREFTSNIPTEEDLEEATSLGEEIAPITIDLRNGTLINGLASEQAEKLESFNFEMVNVGNASLQNRSETVIYDLTPLKPKESALLFLKENLTTNIETVVPPYIEILESADFLILLGPDVFY